MCYDKRVGINFIEYYSANKYELCDCQDICMETKYKASVSQSTYPSNQLAAMLKLNQQMWTVERNAFTRAMYVCVFQMQCLTQKSKSQGSVCSHCPPYTAECKIFI